MKEVLIVLNSALPSSESFRSKVFWIKETDLSGGSLNYAREFLARCANWVKRNAADARVSVLYVVDSSLLDALGLMEYQNLWEARDAVKEKAVQDGRLFLKEAKGIFLVFGLEAVPQVKFGGVLEETLRAARELGADAVLAADSPLAEQIKLSIGAPVFTFSKHSQALQERVKQRLELCLRSFSTYLKGGRAAKNSK